MAPRQNTCAAGRPLCHKLARDHSTQYDMLTLLNGGHDPRQMMLASISPPSLAIKALANAAETARIAFHRLQGPQTITVRSTPSLQDQ